MTHRYYTIGIAGHINHGKTTLTKALTNIDTDRLIVEKERNISIELGYAPLSLYGFETSIIDVPGHEKFIRKMIAGVAGIDLVILVVAADEGVMPQTKEHIEILTLLGIEHGIIVVTKINRVEYEFLEIIEEDIKSAVEGSLFEGVEILYVESISGEGLDNLKYMLVQKLKKIPLRISNGILRLPIDQVFTIHGQGVVVRGTIYEGTLESGDSLTILPQHIPVKAKEVQIHNKVKNKATAGQRAAINIGGVQKQKIRRGDVIVSSTDFEISNMIDVTLKTVKGLEYPVKQRTTINFYSGTNETSGNIVFFDRNELHNNSEVLCQILLKKPIVVKRGDRFIVRRPSPVETIGGGWIISASSEKYRYGQKTIEKLLHKKEASPEDRILDALAIHKMLSTNELSKLISLYGDKLNEILEGMIQSHQIFVIEPNLFTSSMVYDNVRSQVKMEIQKYHKSFPLRIGISKAECIQVLQRNIPKKLGEIVINKEIEEGLLLRRNHFIHIPEFAPHVPEEWNSRFEKALEKLEYDKLEVLEWSEYLGGASIPEQLHIELTHYVVNSKLAYRLDDKHLIHHQTFEEELRLLYVKTNNQAFCIQDAKGILNGSRKKLIMFLELLDYLQITRRENDKRQWIM
ncbi:selenocysteine-specific translation elongation factor [Paenibacillus sp. EZ-K15]|uniref:selenocysteine-specific translation elongation factor n=1 Tax=Paenibacillus sp. EZ-K15 TaxID=2044275 RepID=UPI000BF2A113|nr:selenocysteine-specific translation elongation factor [Paenibacillus sp. EZ-K15]